MIGETCHLLPALSHIVKLVVAQTIMGYFGGNYRTRFVTRLVMSQWIQVFAQTRYVDFVTFLKERKHFVHVSIREMLVRQLQFAPILQFVIDAFLGFDTYEKQVYVSTDTLRGQLDKPNDEEWLQCLPSRIVPVSDQPTVAEEAIARRMMHVVQDKFDGIFRTLEPILNTHRSLLKKMRLRKKPFAHGCASILKKKLKKKDPNLVLKNMAQTWPDPVLDEETRLAVNFAATYAARRGDHFFEIPILAKVGVREDILQTFLTTYTVYDGNGKADNSMLAPMEKYFDPSNFPEAKKSLVIIHRFCEDYMRVFNTVVVSLAIHVGEMQVSALRNKAQISITEPTPRDIGVIYLCRCGRLLTPKDDPSSRNKNSSISGVTDAAYDIYRGCLHCSKNVIPACKEPAIEIDLVGKALCLKDKMYAFCVICGILTSVSVKRWKHGPVCGSHCTLPEGVFNSVKTASKASQYADFELFEKLVREKIPPPPNSGRVCQCIFCDVLTSSDIGRVSMTLMDTSSSPPKEVAVHICFFCDLFLRRRYPYYPTLTLSAVKRLYVQWDEDDKIKSH